MNLSSIKQKTPNQELNRTQRLLSNELHEFNDEDSLDPIQVDDLKLQLAEIKKEMNNKKITEEIELEGNSIDVSELFSNSLDL